jgi:hypothetical protein
VPASPVADASGARDLRGTWRRMTEPYKGLVIRIQGSDARLDAVVTEPPPVTDARIAAQAAEIAPKGHGEAALPPGHAHRPLALHQLECQRSLWRSGERYLEDIRSAEGGHAGTVVVRDWGLTNGVCRQADSHARARLELVGEEGLMISVERPGVPAKKQEWKRVPGV